MCIRDSSEEEIAVTVGKVDEVVEIELVNYFIKGNIELTKVDADYPDNKLTGAVFEVYADTNGNGEFDKDDEPVSYTHLDVYKRQGQCNVRGLRRAFRAGIK